MKLVINKCYGGFGLSPLAVKRICERKGRPCYFFTQDISDGGLRAPYTPTPMEALDNAFIWWAFDVPDPRRPIDWRGATADERTADSAWYEAHSIGSGREIDRADPDMIAVVEELGDAANGKHAELRVVEIPDGTDYELDEYAGVESIHEVHRSWA